MDTFSIVIRADPSLMRALLSPEQYALYERQLAEEFAAKRKRLEESGYTISREKNKYYLVAYKGDTSVFLNKRGTPRYFQSKRLATQYIECYLDTIEDIQRGEQ